MNFIYITKKVVRSDDGNEVSVTWSRPGGKMRNPDLRFSFSESIKIKAFKKADYLVAAYDRDIPTRIWFDCSDKTAGYKLSKSERSYRYVFCPTGMADVIENATRFVGNYELYYDPIVKMWYIDSEKRVAR